MKIFIKLVFLLYILIGNSAYADYQLGEGDIIRVIVYADNDFTRELRVGENGLISLPLVGLVDVNNLTTYQAEQKIAEKLSSGGFLKKPQISVVVTQFLSKSVSVLGAVYKSGRYPILRSTSVRDIIAEAGGLTPDASDNITVIIGENRFNINLLSNDQTSSNSSSNMKLIGGETILVSARDVSILGYVNKPGKYALQGGSNRISDFISMAGGLTEFANHNIIHYSTQSGTTISNYIDLDNFFKKYDANADKQIYKGDIIYVPQAEIFYAYGEVQRPGMYKIDKNMNIMQALAKASGLTTKGTQRSIVLHRKNKQGEVYKVKADLLTLLQNDDVIFVEESLF